MNAKDDSEVFDMHDESLRKAVQKGQERLNNQLAVAQLSLRRARARKVDHDKMMHAALGVILMAWAREDARIAQALLARIGKLTSVPRKDQYAHTAITRELESLLDPELITNPART
ncbi:hypothetical protein [Orrella marina]|uniref:Uncharacterized protein n=1 Tax=Orrella marina TaxID=2163011 RepID=A0A2R4XJL1_9BURK|nr:hypothetical protein [Orrella marina]AWB33976.1 hypothetical protein DBV39_09920 [Orrella marina]